MTEIVYSREVVALTAGQTFQNPRFFAGPIAGVESVVVHGDFPAIVAAYVAAGVPVTAITAPAVSTTHEPAPGDFGPLADAFVAEMDAGAAETVAEAPAPGDAAPATRRTRKRK